MGVGMGVDVGVGVGVDVGVGVGVDMDVDVGVGVGVGMGVGVYCIPAVVAATVLLLLRGCKTPPKFAYFIQPHECSRILSAHNLIMRIIKIFQTGILC